MKKVLVMAMLSLIASPAFAWDGYDASTGEAVEIGKGNLVRSGRVEEVSQLDGLVLTGGWM